MEGNGEPGVLLEKWENDLRPLGDLLPAVAEYLQKLQETSPLELMGLLNTSQYGGT